MKKAVFLWVMFVLAGNLLSAQEIYTGGAMPQGYTPERQIVQQPLTPPLDGEFYPGSVKPDNYVQGPLYPANSSRDVFFCPDCAIPEGEPDIPDNGTDVTNGGCNSVPERFIDMAIGQTYCGRGNGYVIGTSDYRDTDWYRITFSTTTTVYFSGIANFNCVLIIVGLPCSSQSVLDQEILVPNTVGTATATVPAGTYAFFVAPNGFGSNPALDGDYAMTVTTWPAGGPETWCFFTGNCISCGIPEGEPSHVDNVGDLTNYGCNGAEFDPDRPPIFSPIEIGDVICGTGDHYVYNASTYRDTDWYRLVLTSAKTLYWSVTADFSMSLIIIQGPCDAQVFWGFAAVPAHGLTTLSATLEPGEYYFWAGPSDWNPENNGSYMATLTEYPPLPPAQWCGTKLIPLSGWALFLGIGLILLATIVRFRKML